MANGDEEPVSEFELHSNDPDWFDEGDEVYDQMLEDLIQDFPDAMDQHAADLLYDGWFNSETDRLDRAEIWFDFFDYTGIAWEDFDWDTWREWYEA